MLLGIRTLKYSRSEVTTAYHDDCPLDHLAIVQCLSNHLAILPRNVLKRNVIFPDRAFERIISQQMPTAKD